MKIQYTTELDYQYECLTMLTRLIAPSENGSCKSFDTFREEVLLNPAHTTEEIETVFNQLETVAKEILSQLMMPADRLKFYFTPFYEDISLAALAVYAKPILFCSEEKQKQLLCWEILSSLFGELFETKELPETENELMDSLESLPIPVEAKWKSLLFFRNFAEYERELTTVFEKAEMLLQEKVSFFTPYIAQELNKIRTAVSENGTQWLEKRYHINPNAESFTVGISLMRYNAIEVRAANAIFEGCEKNLTFRVGILVNQILEQQEKQNLSDENLLRSLKTLNDKNRLQILHLLKRSPLCGQEIAEQLGITPATVSHHMNDLANRNFVALDRIGAKINYRLYSEGIQHFLEELQKSLL